MSDQHHSPAATWTVTTWNLHGSAGPDLARVADAIVEESPDIVLLQEVRRAQARALAEAMTMRFSWARKHFPYSPLLHRLAEGLAIMTPHALGAPGHTELSIGQSNSSWRRRIAQWALVGRSDGAHVRVYNTHLSPHGDAAARRAEAVRLAEVVDGHGDDPPALVGGDFNDDGDASVIFALPGIEHVTPSCTNPAHQPTQLLDHVLLPVAARGVSVTVPAGGAEWAELSDHLPVTVRFALDP